MLNYNPLQNLPSSDELPDSDDTPVDNELQNLIPALLRSILNWLWGERMDWFFGINMGIYHTTGTNPRIAIVPDGFLSLGVERLRFEGTRLRPSYVTWEENNIVPIFVLEVVSHTYGQEYDEKMSKYARLGVLYYCVYNPEFWRRDKHNPFEVYRLVGGVYQLQVGEPVWMAEIGLGIGRAVGSYDRCEREWLYWYDQQGNRFPSIEEIAAGERFRAEQERLRAEQERLRAEQERLRAEQERLRAESLAEQLRAMGINRDPDEL